FLLALGWLPLWGTVSAASCQSVAQREPSKAAPPPRLCIHLYNLADVSPQTLDRAAEVAASVLATAGVDIVWRHGPADSPEARTFDETGYSKWQHPEPD